MELLNISQAADILKVTRQSVHLSIRGGKLKAMKIKGMWATTVKEIQKFVKNLYKRPNRCKTGEVTVKQAAEILKVHPQRIYYLVYSDRFVWEKRNGMIFIQRNSLVC